MADIDTTILAVIAGFWAATNIVFSTAKISNERRDVVMTGKLDGDPIDLDHRWLILRSDWLPMTVTNVFICLFFSIFLAVLPLVSPTAINGWGIFVCCLFATIPLFGSVVFAAGGRQEYRRMVDVLRAASKAGP